MAGQLLGGLLFDAGIGSVAAFCVFAIPALVAVLALALAHRTSTLPTHTPAGRRIDAS